MPRQGILPHDLVHALVESRLGFSDGFMGLVAKGAEIAFAGQQFHRYIDPANHLQVAQAESVVESLQAQLWSGCFDDEPFHYGVSAACKARGVPAPEFIDVAPKVDLFDAAVALGASWHAVPAVPAQATWQLDFPRPDLAQGRAA